MACTLVDWDDCDKKADCGKVRSQAKALYGLGYRKLAEDSVVITKEQKAKIEQLKETSLLKENEQLKKDLQRKELLRQKAVLYAEEKHAKNVELQKQVDELKEKSKEVNDLVKEKVKDTAKEICLKIIKDQPQPIKEKWVEWFKKEYGVEVEE